MITIRALLLLEKLKAIMKNWRKNTGTDYSV
jgi:hypothetical protein